MKLFALFSQNKAVDVPKTVDEIEDAVYARLKPYGFKKYGRTLHRFVSEDISQVIHFQSGMPTKGMGGLLCVNIGIRIPECADRAFQPQDKVKKYYHEYECTMRSRLGIVGGQKETWYKLSDRIDGIRIILMNWHLNYGKIEKNTPLKRGGKDTNDEKNYNQPKKFNSVHRT